MSNTFTIFRGHAYTYRPGTPEGPTTKAIAYLAYSGRDKLFVVKAVNEHGKTRCLLRATDFNEAVKYYEAEFPGIGAKRDEFNNPNIYRRGKLFPGFYRTLLSYLTEWKDTLVKGQTHHTDWERNHDNYKTFCQNKVDPTHLLQVIRDMDRRITDLERKLEHSGG